ncbi:MAG: type II secretion system protein [Fimbriimonas sp.]
MNKGFTLIEVLVSVAIVAIIAAITFPVYQRSKLSANQSVCISNLQRLGVALALYRSDWAGSDVGSPAKMGMPPSIEDMAVNVRCRGNVPSPGVNGYTRNYEVLASRSPSFDRAWTRYVEMTGMSAVWLCDTSHQDFYPRSLTWDSWRALALRLDGGVYVRTRMGFPRVPEWWIDRS